MPSPDVSPYVDLTLFDKTAADIYADALTAARALLPEWEPREGNIELVLMQALAMEAAETVFSINRVPGAVVEVLLQLFGLTRSSGGLAESSVDFTAVDDATYSIPAGTRLLYEITGVDPIIFTTDDDLTLVTPGGGDPSVGNVTITAIAPTAAYNGIAAPVSLTILAATPFIASAVTGSTIAGGSSAETDDEYFTRGKLLLGRLSECLVLPDQFSRYILETYTAVYRAKALDLVDPSRVPDQPGFLAIAACTIDGGLLSIDQKTAILADVQDRSQSNIVISILDPLFVRIDVSTTFAVAHGYSSVDVTTAVNDALSAYFDPNLTPWVTTVRRNELIALVSSIIGVEYVVDLTLCEHLGVLDTLDVTSTDPAPLFTAGDFVLTATTP